MVLALLGQQLQDVHLVPVYGVVDGTLELVRGPAAAVGLHVDVGVFASLLAVLLVGPRPTHPGLNVYPGPVLQQHLHTLLVAPETGDVEGERAAASVDVDISGDAPPDHLQVVNADTLLQQIVSLLIVDQQNVLAAGLEIVMTSNLVLMSCFTFLVSDLTGRPVAELSPVDLL